MQQKRVSLYLYEHHKVNGETSGLMPFRAQDIPAPIDPYAIAKHEAEEALLKTAHHSNMRATIVRPPLVYGPGVKGNFISPLKSVVKAGRCHLHQ